MFPLSFQELKNLMSQNAISSSQHGGTRNPPRIFTEYGAVMAANVLNSDVAIDASIMIVRVPFAKVKASDTNPSDNFGYGRRSKTFFLSRLITYQPIRVERLLNKKTRMRNPKKKTPSWSGVPSHPGFDISYLVGMYTFQ